MSELIINNITVTFGGLRAITNVSLRLSKGTILGLIGPNGAGKTTLVNCISGFLRPTSGSISLNNEISTKWGSHVARRAGISRTFQSTRLFSTLSVLENVESAGVSLGLSRQAARVCARKLLDWVGYEGEHTRVGSSLPYVDVRRVGMARALMCTPDFVLLDEPAAGMSDSESEQLSTTIRKLPQEYGCGVLLIEHNMKLIERVCSWVHVLDCGCTLAEGVPREVLNNRAVISAYLGDAA